MSVRSSFKRSDDPRVGSDYEVKPYPADSNSSRAFGSSRPCHKKSGSRTAGDLKPQLELYIWYSKKTTLGVIAAVQLYRINGADDWQQLYVDEVKLWQAKSRQRFIKKCMEIIGDTSPNFEQRADAWLQEKNQNPYGESSSGDFE